MNVNVIHKVIENLPHVSHPTLSIHDVSIEKV